MSLNDLDNACKVYGDLITKKKEIEAALKELEPIIKESFADKGLTVRSGYAFKATTQAGRKTLDKKALTSALSQHGLDLDAFYTVGAPYVRMSVDVAN